MLMVAKAIRGVSSWPTAGIADQKIPVPVAASSVTAARSPRSPKCLRTMFLLPYWRLLDANCVPKEAPGGECRLVRVVTEVKLRDHRTRKPRLPQDLANGRK